MAKKRITVPLVIEPHPETYKGYPFVTLIQHQEQSLLCIIDNFDNKTITALVLDYCVREGIDEKAVVTVAEEWYKAGQLIPLSIYISRRDLKEAISPLYRQFDVNFVSRVIGPLPTFFLTDNHTVKKRKRKIPTKNVTPINSKKN